ncbi:ATP-binding protein [Neptuniibacter caesariensis]|uniref:histidine kinase n=1 Tax=Neptuniibacter caesariensis TaxID=207954 RepID=A0A7U8C819_NEPCE|nr:ATP-binding protein [Neptuniibacter caesariensis]EAR63029.1 probable two-component sensor [Oceanospirillum sp. MED92] [Neptuniibacter caesariensis]
MANHRENLLQLSYIRTVTLFGQCLAVIFAIYGLQAELNIWLIGPALAVLALLNLITYARLMSPWPVTEPEFFTQLIADMSLYGAILFHMGGATNPFIFLLLVPLIIASATLSKRYVWLVAITVVVIYSSLLFYYEPLIQLENNHQHRVMELFDFHIVGMWINFLLTVLVVTYFIVRMQQSMQKQQEKLEQEREKRIQDQQLLSLATMAAGTAHELGTPLSTMQVLLKELEHEHQANPELLEDIELLRQQTDICAKRLKQMAQSVKQEQSSTRLMAATLIIDETIEQLMIQRPEVSYSLLVSGQGDSPSLNCSTSLRQSLLNLLNNAADAQPKDIAIELDWDQQHVFFRIHDKGPGISIEQSENLGKPFVTTKGKGLGIGLFLTATTLARYAGDVRLYNHPNGGTLTEVTLPIRKHHE